MTKIVYYELKRVEYERDPRAWVTAAVWSCKLCCETIDNSGGPGYNEICVRCGDEIIAGQMRYVPDPIPNTNPDLIAREPWGEKNE